MRPILAVWVGASWKAIGMTLASLIPLQILGSVSAKTGLISGRETTQTAASQLNILHRESSFGKCEEVIPNGNKSIQIKNGE